MPQVIPFVVTAITTVTSAVVAAGPWAVAAFNAANIIGAAALANEAFKAVQPQVKSSSTALEWNADPNAPNRFAFGRVGGAGNIIHNATYGPDKMFVGFVGVMSASGPIKSWQAFKADDAFVSFDTSGKAINTQYANVMWLNRQRGAQPEAAYLASPSGLKNGAAMPRWGASYKLSGKAAYHYTLAENSKRSAYKGKVPTGIHYIEGLYCYDPRLDSSYPGGAGPCRIDDPMTWVYSTNAYIHGLNWNIGRWEGPATGFTPTRYGVPYASMKVGGIGARPDGIDFAAYVEAANVFDENGWACAAWPDADQGKGAVLDSFLQAGGGIYAERQGKVSCLHRAAPRASIVTITADDTAGTIEYDTTTSLLERINTIRPEYWSEVHGWQMVATDEVTSSVWREEDGQGVEVTKSKGLAYNYVPQSKQARELAALQIAHTREGIRGTAPLRHYLDLDVGDCFTFQVPEAILNGQKCIVLNVDPDLENDIINVTFASESDAKYPFAFGQTDRPPPAPGLQPADNSVTPPLPEDWVIVPRPPAPDGTQVPGFDLSGIVSNDTADAMLVNWREVAVGEDPDAEPAFQDEEGVILPGWNDAGIWPPTTRTLTIQGPQSGSVVWLAIRYKRGNNYSEPVLVGPKTAPTLAGVPVIDTTPPGVPAGLALSSTSTPDAAGNPYVRINATWTANTDEDLNGYEVEVTESGFTIVEGVATNSYSRTALTGRSYAIRVRAIDKAGNRSDWSPVQNVTGAGDTTPPSAPTALAVSVSLGSFFLEWTNPSASDLSKIEVWEHTSNANGSATRIATVNAQSGAKGSYARSGMAAGAVRYYWLKAVDTSGNASVFSGVASGTIPNVPAGEIDTTPPGVPSGLSLSTSLVTDTGTGLPRPRVVATWTGPGDADLAGFDVEVTEGGGSPVTRMVSGNRDQWDSRPNVSYQVRVRAFDRVGNRSAWSSSQSITAPADSVAPAAPTALAAVASVGSVFLSGIAPSDSDTAKIEVWENTTNNSGTATRIAVVNAIPGTAWAHPRTGLSANDTRWYWARAVDTSGNASVFSTGISRTVPYVANPDIAVGTLAGDRLLANSVEGSVFKTNTSLPGTIEVGSTGVTIQTVQSQANDPAARINAQSTKIDPGKITLWGSGALSDLPDWRMGGDVTRIDGGKISAGTVKANSAEFGLRGVESSLTFTANDPGANRVSWSAGAINYVNNSGTTTSVAIGAGATAVLSSFPQALSFSATTGALVRSTVAEANADPNAIILAVYYGGTNLVTNYGRTIIDGDIVRTGALETRHHSSLSITTELLAAGAVTGEKVTANSFDGSVFKTNTSLPGTITVGGTGVTIQTVQSQAANPAATINGGTTRIDPGQITVSGGTTLSSWRHGSDLTKIDGGSIYTNSIKANSVEIGLRGVYFDRFNFTEAGGVLTWGTGRATYTGDAGTTLIVDIAAGSHTYTGTGVTYVYWVQGATTLSFTKVTAEANGPNAIIIGTFYGAGNFTAGYGRTVINGDQIQTGAITAIKINVTDLSSISANIGNITAGRIGNAAGTTFFDLTNARQQFAIGAYVSRKGALGSGVLEWYGPNSVALGSETRTNGKFALGDDGIVYYGAAPLTPGSGVLVPKIVSVSAQTAVLTFDNALTDGIWDMSLYALSAPGWPSGAPSGTWAIYEQNVGSVGTAGTLIASGSVRPNGDYEPTTFDFGGGASSAVKVAGNRQLRVIVSGISATNLIFRATYTSATGGGGGGGSGGGSTGPALSDTSPPSIAAAGAVGTAVTAARGDHTHAHGNQGGGALHANVTTSANGFMSAADKTKLNTYPSTAPALLSLTPVQDAATGDTLVQRNTNGDVWGSRLWATGNHVFFGSGSYFLRRLTATEFNFSHAVTGPAFTPTSDPDLKENIEAVCNDPAALVEVLSAGQIEYDRVQDGVHALGFSAKALRDINPLWVVGGEVLDPDGPVEDLDGSVIDEDGVTFRRPLAVDPMAMISSLFAAVRQLANDTGYLEARHEQALSRTEALEATVAALTAA